MPQKRTPTIRFKPLIICLAITIAGGLLWTLTATPHAPYRAGPAVIATSIDELLHHPDQRQDVEHHCVEAHVARGESRPWFSVSFVEFDDQGSFWTRDQLDTLERHLAETAARSDVSGVLMVTLAHGWMHNASVCDETVACFRGLLAALSNMERQRAAAFGIKPRYVLGVYVGWRGLSHRAPVLPYLSFYGRKAAAHRIGRGDAVELLTRLETWRDRLRSQGLEDTKLVIVGHSFGGALIYSSLAQIFHERLARAVEAKKEPTAPVSPVYGFGDLVVLVNPAFEASLYSGIHTLTRSMGDFPARQPAVLLTVGSDTDLATRLGFPMGRYASSLRHHTRDASQAKSLRTTLGNFEPFQTHRLEKVQARGAPFALDDIHDLGETPSRGRSDCTCRFFTTAVPATVSPFPFEDMEPPSTKGIYGSTQLRPVHSEIQDNTPFIVARTTDDIVTAHSGIFNKLFINFLRTFLWDMDQRTKWPEEESPDDASKHEDISV